MVNHLTLVDPPERCPTCELIRFWREWMAWDEEWSRIWESWPDGREDDPPGADAHMERQPRSHPWARAVFEYDAGEAVTAIRGLVCGIHLPTPVPTFTPPAPADGATLTFELIPDDGDGPISSTDTVSVAVNVDDPREARVRQLTETGRADWPADWCSRCTNQVASCYVVPGLGLCRCVCHTRLDYPAPM